MKVPQPLRPVPESEVREVDDALSRAYVIDKTELLSDPPLDSLIRTILSQNTNDRNRDLAFARLKTRYLTWEEVPDAPLEDVIEAIHSSNHSPTKARRIQAILEELKQREGGKASLEFLREIDTEAAMEWLLQLEGVGKKTAACVLMFSLNRPVMPVDTHIHRVAQRLEWIGPKTNHEAAHDVLSQIVPPEVRYTLHVNFWEHGRVVCRPTAPKCGMCVIYRYCRYADKTAPEPSEEEAQGKLEAYRQEKMKTSPDELAKKQSDDLRRTVS